MYEIFIKSSVIDKRGMDTGNNKVRFQIVFSSQGKQLPYLCYTRQDVISMTYQQIGVF